MSAPALVTHHGQQPVPVSVPVGTNSCPWDWVPADTRVFSAHCHLYPCSEFCYPNAPQGCIVELLTLLPTATQSDCTERTVHRLRNLLEDGVSISSLVSIVSWSDELLEVDEYIMA